MLQSAIDAEVDDYLPACPSHRRARTTLGRQQRLSPRAADSDRVDEIFFTQRRARDNDPGPERRVRFAPSVKSSYLRKTSSIEELIAWLYLKAISTSDFAQALVGERAAGLSPNVVCRLKKQWCSEYDDWGKHDLSGKRYVYVWADGIYTKVRLEDDAD
ncbi:Transposase, Mutator family [Crateriforma conspicua]|uniref:transposase n=1 Tax=Crateriforma conspicua TaxID=2527996 RepID=UPI0011889D83|nr:transposase [Crateriforma conspicua]QDV63773.1 Transposase, Mutator family [Crateriforma conspicua]